MKKIVLLLILTFSGITFSNECKWISNPDYILQVLIKKANEKKIKNNIYCDSNREYMLYYNNDDNIELGFIFNEKEKKEITFDDMSNFLRKVSVLLYYLSEAEMKISYSDMPNDFIVRVYVYDPDKDDIFMLFKTRNSLNNSRIYYNKEYFEMFEGAVELLEESEFYPTEDVVY